MSHDKIRYNAEYARAHYVQIAVRVPPAYRDRLKEIAEMNDTSIAKQIMTWIERESDEKYLQPIQK